ENVSPFVADVGCFGRHRLGQFVLEGHVPGVDRRKPLLEVHDSRSNAVGQEESSVRRQGSKRNAATIRRRIQPEERREGRRSLGQGEDVAEVGRRVQILTSQDRKVLGHGVTEYRPEDSEVVAAPITGANYGSIAYLISDAEARSEVQAVIDAAI